MGRGVSFLESLTVETGKCLSEIPNSEEVIEKIVTRELEKLYSESEARGKAPKDYQKRAIEHMLDHRGLLVCFKMGSGKTLTAVLAAELCRRIAAIFGFRRKVIFVSPVSLIANFKSTVEWFGLDIDQYEFYSMDIFSKKLLEGEASCGDSFLAIDEIHNFRTDFRGEFSRIKKPDVETRSRAETLIGCGMRAWKVMGLTGTPVYNRRQDIINIISIVRGEIPLARVEFEKVLENRNLLEKYLKCVSTFHAPSPEGYPTRIDHPVFIEMPKEYETAYLRLYYDQKAIFRKKPGYEEDDEEEVKSDFMVKLRQEMNMSLESIKNPELVGRRWFPKLEVALSIIENRKGACLVYSEFKSKGIWLLSNKVSGYLIDGETSARSRSMSVNSFNRDADLGRKPILYITKAGGEGLDLRRVRDVIIMEGGWNMSREEQVIARAIRLNSHPDFPPEEKTVEVHYLLLHTSQERGILGRLFPKGRIPTEVPSSFSEIKSADLYLKIFSIGKMLDNEGLLRNMKRYSIENYRGCTERTHSERRYSYPEGRRIHAHSTWLFQAVIDFKLAKDSKLRWVSRTKIDTDQPLLKGFYRYVVLTSEEGYNRPLLRAVCDSIATFDLFTFVSAEDPQVTIYVSEKTKLRAFKSISTAFSNLTKGEDVRLKFKRI